MDVILTHEQADFDAIASLFCARLLDENAKAVLPNRQNRNVRNFLNLYGTELPLVEARDLPAATAIHHITLVDTQSLVTLKGVSTRTTVSVIDHHEKRTDLPAGWLVRIEKVGATTTILVDLLRDVGRPLTTIEATLLLLGIYEDTGSLTYASTTVRDIKAAAFLMERGASLRIAAEFLNPALSENQKRLSDLLLDNAQTVTIHGQKIILSYASALELNEEVSSIAHKLRDLLDPDALFLFVHTAEGIRLVARSTSDAVDVSQIASLFGGGGHERAAAALIQLEKDKGEPTSMAALCDQVIEELNKTIKPPLTVGKIMSRKPQLISPQTSLNEANRLMQHYGYEGYPVVEDGKVVGLLTRRAVDRALQHKLNLNAGSLMEAGEHYLKSTDTIDQLQQLMAATGWGQVPVVDGETNKIIGIVTRTDLLKTLPGHNGVLPGQKNYASMLEKALPPCRLALLKLIASVAGEEQQSAYIVGGFVRDLLLERPSLDFDIVIEGDALQFAHALAGKYGGRVITHRRFSTAKWQIKDIRKDLLTRMGCTEINPIDLPEALDFISARTEFYDRPTALPTVERSSIKLDLHRRDFTINTLALRLDSPHYGELYDYWGGLADLEKKQVRVLHSLSFVDDPTRLLRAVRFEQRFQFQIEKRTLQLMAEAREMLHQLSGERIHHEFDLILNEADPVPIFRRLEALGLLSAIHPRLTWNARIEQAFSQAMNYTHDSGWQLPATVGNISLRHTLAYLVWLSCLDTQSGIEVGRRLRLSRALLETLEKLIERIPSLPTLSLLSPSAFTREMEKIPIYGCYALYCITSDTIIRERLRNYAEKWRFIKPGIDGHDLQQRGLTPGPGFASILAEIRDAWIDGRITSPEEEDLLIDKLISETTMWKK